MKKKSDVKTSLFYIKQVFNFVLDFIWPQFCLGCKKEGQLLCAFCLNDIVLEENTEIVWPDITKQYFDSCHLCASYQNKTIEQIIKKYKYSYLEHMAIPLVDILEKQARRLKLPKDIIITNLPLHKNKYRQRGFDQTEILAKKLASRLGKNYFKLLKRVRHTKSQASLDKKARAQNMQNAFVTAKRLRPLGGSILLIDDVATTGSTLNEAAKTLKQAGYSKIICLVIAKN